MKKINKLQLSPELIAIQKVVTDYEILSCLLSVSYLSCQAHLLGWLSIILNQQLIKHTRAVASLNPETSQALFKVESPCLFCYLERIPVN